MLYIQSSLWLSITFSKNPDATHNLCWLVKPTYCTWCLHPIVFSTEHYKKDNWMFDQIPGAFWKKQETPLCFWETKLTYSDVFPQGSRSCQNPEFLKFYCGTVLIQSIYLENNNSGIKNKVSLNLVSAITKTDYGERICQRQLQSGRLSLGLLKLACIQISCKAEFLHVHLPLELEITPFTNASAKLPLARVSQHYLTILSISFRIRLKVRSFECLLKGSFTLEKRGVYVNMSRKTWRLWLKMWTEKLKFFKIHL